MLTILPIGGRIKAASIGLDRFTGQDSVEINRTIAKLREKPCEHLRRAFFPRIGKDLRHVTSGIGLYRPVLKTDQGMPGNFLPFTIDCTIEHTDLSIRTITYEEGAVIPEAWNTDSNGMAHAIRSAFSGFNLQATYELLQQFEARHVGENRPDKGHRPFMFIRPALADRSIVLGNDIVLRVGQAVENLLDQILMEAHDHEKNETGANRPHNLLYAQPDVFVLADGTVVVEKIQCPDVGFFLTGVVAEDSRALPLVQKTVQKMGTIVVENILEKMGTTITIVTRDEVITNLEDVLEIREIEFLREALVRAGASVNVIPVSAVDSVEKGTRLLLLNLDYKATGVQKLLQRHGTGDVDCFPNPYVQMACAENTGLFETRLDPATKHGKIFLDLARSQTATDAATIDVLRQIDRALTNTGMTSDVIHVTLPTETVPMLRQSLHSWRQLAARASREENQNQVLRFRGIPAKPENLILTSSTGPRLHAFRFMCTT